MTMPVDLASQPLRNVLKNPKFGNSNSTNFAGVGASQATTTVSYDTTDRPLPTGVTQVVQLTSTGNWGRRWSGLVGDHPAPVGSKFVLSFWIKVNEAATITTYAEWNGADGSFAPGASYVNQSWNLVANTWTNVVSTITVTGTGAAWIRTFGWLSTTQKNAGFEFRVANGMAVPGDVTPPAYIDGDTPGWRWTGTAQESISVGYPYTLESIAGQPLTTLTGFDQTGPTLTLTQLPALSGRTVYSVTDRVGVNATTNATGDFTSGSTDGGATESLILRQANNTGHYQIRPQFDGGGGSGGAYGQALEVNASPVGRHVVAWTMPDGLTEVRGEVDGGTERSRSDFVPGNGILKPRLATRSVTGYEVPVFAAYYRGFHNAETRRRVAAWLARRYNSPIPVGY